MRDPVVVTRKYNDTGKLKVNSKPTATIVSKAKNFARTIWVSEMGRLKSISIVLFFFSSENVLIATAGTKTIISHGRISKKGRKEAEPYKNISLTNKKLANTPNKTMTM